MPSKEQYAKIKEKELNEARIEKREIKESKSIDKMIKKQYIPLDYLQNLFPSANISENDVEEVNEVMKFGDSERYSEFIALCVQHKNILNDDDCPDFITYLEAMRFISYLNIGKKFEEAYVLAKVKDKEIVEMSMSNLPSVKDKLKHRAMLFAKSRLVIKLQNALDVPAHLFLGGYRFQAFEVLQKEMIEASLSKDRIQAADRLLAHLTPVLEKNQNIQINVNTGNEKSIIDTYKEALEVFANSKVQLITQAKDKNEVIDVKEITNLSLNKGDNDE